MNISTAVVSFSTFIVYWSNYVSDSFDIECVITGLIWFLFIYLTWIIQPWFSGIAILLTVTEPILWGFSVTDSPRDRKGFSGPGWMCPWTRLINHPIWQTTTERRYRESLEQGYAREAVSESVTGGKGYLESWKSLPVRFSRTKLSLIRATSQRSGVIVATLDKMWKSRVLLLPSPGGSDRGSLAISERTVSH